MNNSESRELITCTSDISESLSVNLSINSPVVEPEVYGWEGMNDWDEQPYNWSDRVYLDEDDYYPLPLNECDLESGLEKKEAEQKLCDDRELSDDHVEYPTSITDEENDLINIRILDLEYCESNSSIISTQSTPVASTISITPPLTPLRLPIALMVPSTPRRPTRPTGRSRLSRAVPMDSFDIENNENIIKSTSQVLHEFVVNDNIDREENAENPEEMISLLDMSFVLSPEDNESDEDSESDQESNQDAIGVFDLVEPVSERINVNMFVTNLSAIIDGGAEIHSELFRSMCHQDKIKYIEWVFNHPEGRLSVWYSFNNPERINILLDRLSNRFSPFDVSHTVIENSLDIFKSVIYVLYNDPDLIAELDGSYYPDDNEMGYVSWELANRLFNLILEIPAGFDNRIALRNVFGPQYRNLQFLVSSTIRDFFRGTM
jgi:hypothetical protein